MWVSNKAFIPHLPPTPRLRGATGFPRLWFLRLRMVATSRVEFSLIEYRKALRLEYRSVVHNHMTTHYDQSFDVKLS